MRLAHIRHQPVLREPVWHVVLAIGAALVLQLALDNVLVFGFKYALVGLEILLLVVLCLVPLPASLRRIIAMGLIALISVVNMVSLGLVVGALFGGTPLDGRELLVSGVAIYCTNIIVFGLWYWELDGIKQAQADFLFPQMRIPDNQDWRPTLLDYLYISAVNAMNFSPSDTVPLTHRAKLMMMAQSGVSLMTVALVAARAVNILA